MPVIKAGNISCNEENACKKCWFPCEIERTAGRLADALIAAGIGDVKEAEKEYMNAMLLAVKSQTTASERSRYMELNKNIAEHRAEVAEKALQNMAHRFWDYEYDCPGLDVDKCEECNTCKLGEEQVEEEQGVECLVKLQMRQAEKELAEEGKDENN